MKLTFLGATGTVTGSKYLLEDGGKRFLIDCGLFQGLKELRLRNWEELPLDPASLDAVILTHAHIDHSGYLPLLVRNGFKGPVYCSPGTADLCDILLPDSARLHEEDAARANRYSYSKHHPALPLYTAEDAYNALEKIKPVPFGTEFALNDFLTFKLTHAGHILGAASVHINDGHTKLVFSGDLGRLHDPVMEAPAQIQEADYLVLESTYGDRLHDNTNPEDQLQKIISKTATRGARLLQGETEIKIHGNFYPVRAEIDVLYNISAHADYQETLEWLGHFRKAPRKVFITHGEPEAALSMKMKIEEHLGWRVEIPEYQQSVEL